MPSLVHCFVLSIYPLLPCAAMQSVTLPPPLPPSPSARAETERSCQHTITPCVAIFAKKSCLANLYFRFLLYIAMAIPTFFELPCILGGAILVICAVVYLIAALKGEAWVELTPPRERQKPAGTIIEAPTRAPPRLPSISKMETSSSGATLVGNEVVAQNAVALTVVNEDISVGTWH